jgi:hypothetical protein
LRDPTITAGIARLLFKPVGTNLRKKYDFDWLHEKGSPKAAFLFI